MSGTNARMDDVIARIWARSADLTRARVEAVEQAATALIENALTDEHRAAATSAAHALAGSAGSFGFAHASVLAREAEMLLKGGAPIPSAGVLRLASIAVDLRRELVEPKPAEAGMDAAAAAETFANVIAVDDDVGILELLTAALGPRGIAVHGIDDSTTAASTIAARAPDLIILDVDMPGLDGVRLCRRLRAEPATQAIPIVFLTSHTDAPTVNAMFAAGGDDHVAKPVNADELAARITNRLSRVRQVRAGTASESATARNDHPASSPMYTVDVAVVDDDQVLTALLTHALGSRGYSSVVITEGTAAVDRLGGADPAVRPRVILLDVSLPGLDGLAVLRALSRDGVTRRSRVIMLTARSLESEVLQALEAGAHDHVAKPFSVPVLMQRVRRVLESTFSGA